MLDLVVPKWQGLSLVISGGQAGADEAGLYAARLACVKTGGTAPLGYRITGGSNLALRDVYGLAEDSSAAYPPRTKKNVRNADGTLIIGTNLSSPGSKLTYNYCKQFSKPVHLIRLTETPVSEEEKKNFVQWLIKNEVSTLNVAGNRDKPWSNFIYDSTWQLLIEVFLRLAELDLLTQTET